MEPPFEKLNGVKSVVSGYTGGMEDRPSYDDVSAGRTGHTEAVRVVFDPKVIGYQELVDVFWRNIDPTQADGQFADRGPQYRTGIFYRSDEQRRIAELSKQTLAGSGKFDKPIVTEITAASEFYPAEDYHQDYYKKNPQRYKSYRHHSGREPFIERVWGKS